MIGLGAVAVLVGVVGLWLTRKKAKRAVPQWAWRAAIWSYPLSLLAILVGWVFTEMGRQPWIVFSLMLTQHGVSPNVPGWQVLISLIAFTAIYAALAIVEVGLIVRTAKKGPDPLPGPGDPDPTSQSREDTPTTVY
jgi:cytochrome d ubiquinol oxidase subunit I